MATSELTPEQHKYLNELARVAREKRAVAKGAGRKRREGKQGWDNWYDMVQAEARQATDKHREAWKKLGVTSKQSEYQRECTSLGLCRQCHGKATDSTYCESCKAKAKNWPRRKKK